MIPANQLQMMFGLGTPLKQKAQMLQALPQAAQMMQQMDGSSLGGGGSGMMVSPQAGMGGGGGAEGMLSNPAVQGGLGWSMLLKGLNKPQAPQQPAGPVKG